MCVHELDKGMAILENSITGMHDKQAEKPPVKVRGGVCFIHSKSEGY